MTDSWNRPGASVLDRVVSSNTPTLRALLHSRSQPVAERRGALAVAMPSTPGQAPLPRTAQEATVFVERMSGSSPVGEEATRAAVLAGLPKVSIAHFACHAGDEPGEATGGHLHLHDGTLYLSDVAALDLQGADLVYLSACGTARGPDRLTDEAIHTASAFQLAGYGQAVGTLWEIGDGFAASVAPDFYGRLSAEAEPGARLPAAVALHHTTRGIRAALPHLPSAWASLVHAGA